MGCARDTWSAVARVATGVCALSVIITGIAVAGFHAKVAADDSVVVDRFYANDAWAYSSAVMLWGFGVALLTASFRPAGRLVCGVSVIGTLGAFTLAALAVGQSALITMSGFGDAYTWSPFGGQVNMYNSTMQQAVSMAQECQPGDEVLFTPTCGLAIRTTYDCGDYSNLQEAVNRVVAAATWAGELPNADDRRRHVRKGDKEFLKNHTDVDKALDTALPEPPRSIKEMARQMSHRMWANLLPTEEEVEACLKLDVVFGAPSACLYGPTSAALLAYRFVVFSALMFLAGSLLFIGGVLSCCVPSAKKKKGKANETTGAYAYPTEQANGGRNAAPMPTAPQLSGGSDYPTI